MQLNISPRALSNIETGKSFPSLETASLIDILLGVSCSEYLHVSSDEPKVKFYLLFDKYKSSVEFNDKNMVYDAIKGMEEINMNFDKNSIENKIYSYCKIIPTIIEADYKKSIVFIKNTFNIRSFNKYVNSRINQKTYIIEQFLRPYLCKSDRKRKRTGKNSIKNLSKVIPKMNHEPKLELDYFYTIMLIQFFYIENYKITIRTCNKVEEKAFICKDMKSYFKNLIYKNICNYNLHKDCCFSDIKSAMFYFKVNKYYQLKKYFNNLLVSHEMML